MKINNNKRGISLIVLVITIVVMIILASAIILSISSGDIRGKANEAVALNDIQTSKEIVAVARSEWELNYDELKEKGYETFVEYAEEKLEKADIDITNLVVEESGKIKDCVAICDGIKCSSVEQIKEITQKLKTETRTIDIVLMKDIAITDSMQQIYIFKENSVVLDLNGKKLTGNTTLIKNRGDLTIIDNSENKTGEIVATGDASKYNKTYDINGNGVIDIEDCDIILEIELNGIENNDDISKYDVNNDGWIDSQDAILVIENYNYVFAIINGENSTRTAKLTIDGVSKEKIKGYLIAIENYGTVVGSSDYLDYE